MVKNMNQDYLMINDSTNTVENVVTWDGNPDTWQPPQGYTMLVQATTPAMVWGLNQDATDWILVEQIGVATIGFTWDGTACITYQPKPPKPQAHL
jgi:hypothetical protein